MQKVSLVSPYQLQDTRYLAHTRTINGYKQTETLLAHSQLTLHYFKIYGSIKDIDKIIKRLIDACGFQGEEADKVYLAFVYAIYLHDYGKINPRYQYDVLKNKVFYAIRGQAINSNHALASAYLYLDHMYRLWPEKPTPVLAKCLANFAYCISKHHGNLGNGHDFSDLEHFAEKYYISEIDHSIFEYTQYYMQQQKLIKQPIAFYILCRFLYTLIVGCDYCATQEFMTGCAMHPAIIGEGGRELAQSYNESAICQSIRQYQHNPTDFDGDPINKLRNELFLEAERNLIANPDAHIYYLEAPTGAGKTNMAINLALRVLQTNSNISNIFYVFPFNTLVEQTKTTLLPLFGDKLAIINSITPVVVGGDDRAEDYNVAWLDHLFNNYPIVLTSHVNFFNALFSCGRNQGFPLLKLCNSVIVIDEIQSYKNAIWREIISFLQKYAKLLNMKIIIMSATLPQLDKLLKTADAKFATLIEKPEKYYHHPLFRDRVRLDFSLLAEEKITLDRLKKEVLRFKDKRVLVEFIKKKTARIFYMMCKDECNAVLLTGDDNAIRREQIIKRIRNGEQLVLIATQVIEAGIDIDMEIGFKDISLLDAEEQFLGRVNRSCLNQEGALVYFFDYDDASLIYRGDARLYHSIRDAAIQQLLNEKCFSEFYATVFKDLIARTSRSNEKNIANLDKHCAQFNCKEIEAHMRLIEPNLQLFVPYVWGDLDGYQVWEEFKALGSNKALSYAQLMVEYSRMALKMSYFTYQVFRNNIPTGAEEYGGYFFIDGGERFIEEGVLNREELEKYYGGIFL
ncbi:CRISPR-associated helicase/endonuclease Cas3 [Syntrophomonas wolfei]|mgnify:CR=1 FL=1|jgi:CRISPR-associated endonuclease/helicase Cas3|uniref:CRISPR-associated helicase/endonuclease Cas3 n=1 Tax=Syntrophomonas wolfei TaxID=863 RepID=UPI000772F900|nr:CRISPR-associated helicase/endonuclease Cas3 [Syntrophomonas wolfei]